MANASQDPAGPSPHSDRTVNVVTRSLLPALTSGLILALLEVLLAISFGSLIFAGQPPAFQAQGIGLTLLGGTICLLAVTFMTSMPGMIGGGQDVPAAILAIVTAGIVVSVPAATGPNVVFVTVIAAIALSTSLTGLSFWLIGRFNLGSLVRFLPYPVVGGFLAGTGWLLIKGAASLMTGLPFELSSLTTFAQPGTWSLWLPGLIFGLALLIITRRSTHLLMLPILVVTGLAAFYLFLLVSGTPLSTASDLGWVMNVSTEQSLLPGLWFFEFDQIYWPAIWQQLPRVVALIVVSTAALLLNLSGLELAVENDVDLNDELRAAGAGNFVAGLFGGVMGFQQLSLTIINVKMGSAGRLAGLITIVLSMLVLFAGTIILSFVPMMIIGGLLFFLGMTFLVDWVYVTWQRMPKNEYGVIVLILLITIFVGFLEAVVVGIIVAVILFSVSYSRIAVVRYELTGSTVHSRVSRSVEQRRALEFSAQELLVLALQGFIFFGTADFLLKRVRQSFANPAKTRTRYLILDFEHVTGLDSTAALSFNRMYQLTSALDFVLVLTTLTNQIQTQLTRGGLLVNTEHCRIFSRLDEGVEWCENQILATHGQATMPDSLPLVDQWQNILPAGTDVHSLVPFLEKIEVEGGIKIIEQGDEAQDLFFIERGQVTAQLEQDGRDPVRLQSVNQGVVGEIGFYLGLTRTATVVTDEPTILYRLDRQGLTQLEEEDPEAASILHQIIVNELAERVSHLVTTVDALER